MGRKVLQAAMVILFLCGLGVFLYPKITEWYAAHSQKNAMEEFKEEISAVQKAQNKKTEEKGVKTEALQRLYSHMSEYNQRIYNEGQENLKDPFDYETPSFDLTEYGFESNVIGIIHIPKMDIELPLYLGADSDNMKKGAVILGETSMPIGGLNTNVVVAAHRGYQGTPMFREIEVLESGDIIEITTPYEVLTYEVTETKIVLPDEIHEILIEEGKDKVTLLTCHPYTKNTHRYLVYAERCETAAETQHTDAVSEIEEVVSEEEKSSSRQQIWLETYVPFLGAGMICLLIVCGFLLTRKKK